MKAAVIINEKSGIESKDSTPESIITALEKADIKPEMFFVNDKNIRTQIKSAVSSDNEIIIAAGGDGTISAIAEEMTSIEKSLGILPAGTFNHFAKDLKIPLNMEDAAEVIKAGYISKIDVGEVNGRVFVNNSSVGLYPKAVKARNRLTEKFGAKKWLAMIIASMAVFTRFPLFTISITTPETTLIRKTPFIFIGNNEYKFDLFNLGIREDITSARLSLYTAHISGRLGAIRIAFLALFNKLKPSTFDIHFTNELTIQTKRKVVHVSLDGEVLKMRPPLRYKILPAKMKVFVPGNSS